MTAVRRERKAAATESASQQEQRESEAEEWAAEAEEAAREAEKRTEEKAAEVEKGDRAKPKRQGKLINVNEATFEQLRDLGMSVTQATRVIAYRERQEGFETLDDLDSVPGFPKTMMAELKESLTT